jgi:hypothetical protein
MNLNVWTCSVCGTAAALDTITSSSSSSSSVAVQPCVGPGLYFWYFDQFLDVRRHYIEILDYLVKFHEKLAVYWVTERWKTDVFEHMVGKTVDLTNNLTYKRETHFSTKTFVFLTDCVASGTEPLTSWTLHFQQASKCLQLPDASSQDVTCVVWLTSF